MKPGDTVSCRYAVEAYYSNYGLNKGRRILFSPGQRGTVASIAPKVVLPSKIGRPAWLDGHSDFVVVDFVDEAGKTQRTGLNFCNVVRVLN